MRGLAFYCLLSAAIYALVGMGLGIFMAASHDHTMSTVHAHLNLLGWVSMALFGLYYHAVPQAVNRLAIAHATIATIGLWLLIPGIAMVYLGMNEGVAIAGSLVTISAMALFALIVVRNRAVQAIG
jgi:heme/copper-type cytochrome/quinol oxidase subunit 1